MTRKPLIFLVDDDPDIRELTAAYLQKYGLEVLGFAQADDMLRRLQRLRPDLLLLDWMLPGLSGMDTCKKLRAEQDDLPIIMLTARSEAMDRILGLEMGADDYLGKPFEPRELLARIQAVLRRRPQASLPVAAAEVCLGTWWFDPATRTLYHDQAVHMLTDAEYVLIKTLTERPGQPVSRDRLLEKMHGGPAEDVDPRSIDVAVYRLRKILEPDPNQPRVIQTMRGRGYVFVPPRVSEHEPS